MQYGDCGRLTASTRLGSKPSSLFHSGLQKCIFVGSTKACKAKLFAVSNDSKRWKSRQKNRGNEYDKYFYFIYTAFYRVPWTPLPEWSPQRLWIDVGRDEPIKLTESQAPVVGGSAASCLALHSTRLINISPVPTGNAISLTLCGSSASCSIETQGKRLQTNTYCNCTHLDGYSYTYTHTHTTTDIQSRGRWDLWAMIKAALRES